MTRRELDDLIASLGDIVIPCSKDDGPRHGAVEDSGFQEFEGLTVETVEQLVNEEQSRALDNGAGEQQAGALIAAEWCPTDLEPQIKPFGTMQQNIEQTHAFQRLSDFIKAYIDTAQAQIFKHAAVDDLIAAQQHDAFAQGLEIPSAEVEAIDADMPFGGLAETEENV